MKSNKNFIKLITGLTIANIGDTMYTIAVISSVLEFTHSAFATTLVPVVLMGSMVISGLLTPFLSSRFALTKLLQISQSLKTILLLGLVFCMQSTDSNFHVLIFYPFVASIAFLDGCAEPVSRSLIPYFVQKEFLLKANSLFSTFIHLVSIGSWALGATLLRVFTAVNLVWLDVSIFAVASLLFWLLPKVSDVREKRENFVGSLALSWKYLVGIPVSRVVFVLDIIESIASTAWVSSIVLVFVKEVLRVSVAYWGYINATYFLGSILGSLVLMRFSLRIDANKVQTILFGSFFCGISTLLVIVFRQASFVLFCSFFVGIFGQLKNIPLMSSLQQKIPAEKLTKIYSLSGVLCTTAFTIATIMMGIIADCASPKMVYVVSAALLLLNFLLVYKNRKWIDSF